MITFFSFFSRKGFGVDGFEVQPGRKDDPGEHEWFPHPPDRCLLRPDTPDVYRAPQLQESPARSVILARFTVRDFRYGHKMFKCCCLKVSIGCLLFLLGSTDGRIHIWNAENGTKVCVLNGDHSGPVRCVQFNPKYMMMASACKNMAFWLPSVDEDA